MEKPGSGKRLATEKTVAGMLNISERTLQNLRQRGEGPPYLKIGRLVRYDLDDLETYLAGQRRQSTSQTGE